VKPDPVVVAAGFQDQHAVFWIGGQPVGHDAAGGSCANHDIVEITFKPLRHLSVSTHRTPSCPDKSAKRVLALDVPASASFLVVY
jgi:hypothetical protein